MGSVAWQKCYRAEVRVAWSIVVGVSLLPGGVLYYPSAHYGRLHLPNAAAGAAGAPFRLRMCTCRCGCACVCSLMLPLARARALRVSSEPASKTLMVSKNTIWHRRHHLRQVGCSEACGAVIGRMYTNVYKCIQMKVFGLELQCKVLLLLSLSLRMAKVVHQYAQRCWIWQRCYSTNLLA